MRNTLTRKELDLSLRVRLVWCYVVSVLLLSVQHSLSHSPNWWKRQNHNNVVILRFCNAAKKVMIAMMNTKLWSEMATWRRRKRKDLKRNGNQNSNWQKPVVFGFCDWKENGNNWRTKVQLEWLTKEFTIPVFRKFKLKFKFPIFEMKIFNFVLLYECFSYCFCDWNMKIMKFWTKWVGS